MTFKHNPISSITALFFLSFCLDSVEICQVETGLLANYSCDQAHTPMQWDNSSQAGFSQNPNTWLPVGPNADTVNVQMEANNASSHLHVYKTLLKLRDEQGIMRGTIKFPLADNDIFSFTRL